MGVYVAVEVAKEPSERCVRHAARRQVEQSTQTQSGPRGDAERRVAGGGGLSHHRGICIQASGTLAGFRFADGLTCFRSACTASPTPLTPALTTIMIISANGTYVLETARPPYPRIRAAHPGQIVVQLNINNGVASTEPMWLQLQQLTDLIQKLVMENASFSDGSHSSSRNF